MKNKTNLSRGIYSPLGAISRPTPTAIMVGTLKRAVDVMLAFIGDVLVDALVDAGGDEKDSILRAPARKISMRWHKNRSTVVESSSKLHGCNKLGA